jgi:hypothetical protein
MLTALDGFEKYSNKMTSNSVMLDTFVKQGLNVLPPKEYFPLC